MKVILFGFFMIFMTLTLSGQRTHFHVGLISGANESVQVTTPGSTHYGYRVGMDSKIFGIGAYLLGGAHYLRYSTTGQNEKEFFNQSEVFQIIKARGGLGLTPFSLTPALKIRLKALYAYSYIFDGTDTINIPGVKNSYTSFDLGMGLTLGIFTIDLEYEKGQQGILENENESKFNLWSLTAGIQF